MRNESNNLDALLSVSSEIEAAAIINALAEYDVKAISVGGYTSGFKAEAPGNVAVVVRRADFDRAKQALAEIQVEQGQIDWSKVDVSETLETPLPADKTDHIDSDWRVVTRRLWWILEMLGMAICFFVWLFTRQLTPGLIYAATALALLGIFLALSPLAARRY